MKKKVLLSFFAVICLLVCALLLCGCAEEHIHAFGEWTVVKKPTCTENGEQERLCSCGEKQTQSIPATGHTFGEWQTSKEPTCTEAGEEERLCACGERQTQTIAATGHVFGEWKTSVAPTCTEAGEEECLCVCGEKQTRTVTATGHKFGEWKTCKAATCTANGEEERLCACGERQTQIIPAMGHTWTEATCTAPKTCTKCKATEGKALGHTVTVGKCTRCNTKIHPEVKLPTLGTYVDLGYNAKVYSKVKITSVRYEYDDYGNLHLYCDGEKTYDKDGNSGNNTVHWSYKIYDDGGFVIDSGNLSVGGLSVGEKFKNKEIKISSSTLKKYPSSYYKVIFEDRRL